jgi:hypothetical protein
MPIQFCAIRSKLLPGADQPSHQNKGGRELLRHFMKVNGSGRFCVVQPNESVARICMTLIPRRLAKKKGARVESCSQHGSDNPETDL